MIKSLVTGGAGFIGSNLVDALLEQGHMVVCVDNESASNEEFYWNRNAINIKADVTDYKIMRNCMTDIDYVFHLAAESRLQPAIENPIEAIVKNCVGTTTVLQCAREAGVKKVMYSSTSSGYGMNSYPNVETQPDDCLNPYSASKVAAEKFCKMYTDLYGLKTVVFRYFNVYGPGEERKGKMASVAYQAWKLGSFRIFPKKATRDFVYVKDIVSATIYPLFNNVEPGVYDVGCGESRLFEDVLDLMEIP